MMVPSTWPFWIGARDGDSEKGVLGGKIEGAGYWLAVFTDKKLVRRYAAFFGNSDARAAEIQDATSFVRVLQDASGLEFTHVVFDPSPSGAGGIDKQAVLIVDLLEQMKVTS
jgi:hypothetical protein